MSKLLNNFDFKMASNLLEDFNKSTGFVTALLDLDGNILSKSGWRQICTDFHRINPETAFNCKKSDTILSNKTHIDGKYCYYECLNGLIDVRVPIIIRGEHVANLFSGQFFFEKPNISYFKKQAKKYGFEEKLYIEALEKVPVVSNEEVETNMNFLQNIIQLFIIMTVEKMEQIELNKKLKKSEELLKKNQNKLKKNMNDLLESQKIAHIGTWRLDIETNKVVWSEELYKMYGFDSKLPPPPYTEHMKLFTSESWSKLSSSLERTRKHGIPYELELETVTKDGSNGWMWVRGEAKKDSEGNIIYLWGAAQDITERKNKEDKLVYLSYHDQLTGLYNRRFFEEEIKKMDNEENLPISIIIFDLNGLKMINDSFGHPAGDNLLKSAAKTITKAARNGDLFARIGGDEFVIAMPNTGVDGAIKISKEIKNLASKERVNNIKLSISSGYDTKIYKKQSIIDVIANAENNMYSNKLYEHSSTRSSNTDIIMNALFEKSSREARHSRRVSRICKVIASKMNFDASIINKIEIAGLIHDIGKIGIDEKILNKPGILNEEERKKIEKHPEIGFRILSSTNEFSELAKFILSHHEKWDGSGYPNGAKFKQIPIESRIISIADAYDAMTRKRSYKKEISKKDAIKELKRCSGSQFDPKVVEVFVNKVLIDNLKL